MQLKLRCIVYGRVSGIQLVYQTCQLLVSERLIVLKHVPVLNNLLPLLPYPLLQPLNLLRLILIDLRHLHVVLLALNIYRFLRQLLSSPPDILLQSAGTAAEIHGFDVALYAALFLNERVHLLICPWFLIFDVVVLGSIITGYEIRQKLLISFRSLFIVLASFDWLPLLALVHCFIWVVVITLLSARILLECPVLPQKRSLALTLIGVTQSLLFKRHRRVLPLKYLRKHFTASIFTLQLSRSCVL